MTPWEIVHERMPSVNQAGERIWQRQVGFKMSDGRVVWLAIEPAYWGGLRKDDPDDTWERFHQDAATCRLIVESVNARLEEGEKRG